MGYLTKDYCRSGTIKPDYIGTDIRVADSVITRLCTTGKIGAFFPLIQSDAHYPLFSRTGNVLINLKRIQIADDVPGLLFRQDWSPGRHARAHPAAQDLSLE